MLITITMFTTQGQYLGSLGSKGMAEGQLQSPICRGNNYCLQRLLHATYVREEGRERGRGRTEKEREQGREKKKQEERREGGMEEEEVKEG